MVVSCYSKTTFIAQKPQKSVAFCTVVRIFGLFVYKNGLLASCFVP